MARLKKVAAPDPLAAALLVVEAGGEVHAVGLIYPDGRSKARCGAVAVVEANRRQAAVSALTCPECRAWAEGTD